jgi:phosphopantothenoylcysteine decarboxylase/phosphopantothenate--cysteine ligase
MGIAIADAAAEAGAEVELVLGPVQIVPKSGNIKIIKVVSAASMAEECLSRFKTCDIAILAAAVADFTPQTVSEKKIKKGDGELVIRLKPTTDIASELGRMKRENQFIAGFALETDNELDNAREKLLRKNMDIIVLNSLKDEGAGFGHDTNRITIIDRYNNIDKFGLKSKDEAARDIIGKIISMAY